MKRFVLVYLFTALCISVIAQPRLNAPGQYLLQTLKTMGPEAELPASFVRDYDLIRIGGQWYIGVLGMVNEPTVNQAQLDDLDVINRARAGNIWSFRVPIWKLSAFAEASGLIALEIAEPVSPYLTESLPSARVDSVHAGLGGLMQAYKGQGVIVAVIDWGFDYTHPVFYDAELQALRLSRAWDQNKSVGTPPSGYDFGVEYVGPELLIAQHDTDYVFGPGTHGTHVAGIAGGAGGGPDAVFPVLNQSEAVILGAAPEAELIFISLKRDAPSLIDAFQYIIDYAESVSKPFVVNMSFGSHLGPHDGMDLKNVGIDNLQGPGRIFVGSAGNNGTGNFHLERNFLENGDTLRTVVNIHSSANWGQTLSMWGSEGSSFSASVALADIANQTLFQTPFYHTSEEPQVNEVFLIGNDSLYIRVMSTAAFSTNGKPNIRLEVRNTTPHKIVLMAESYNAHLHMWSNARMRNRYTNWGSNLTSNFPGAVQGNTQYGPGEPAGCGKSVITVGAYRAERINNWGNVQFGNLASFSSRGPTTDERTKPDITGPGWDVLSSVSSFTASGQYPIEFNGRTYEFTRFSGTSMSGPMVAGIVALMLQANPELGGEQVREILKATARLDNQTGAIGEEGSLSWGWGKANALAAVLMSELMAVSTSTQIATDMVRLYPNPASQSVNVNLNLGCEEIQISIYDYNGRKVKAGTYRQNESAVSVPTGDMANGMYLMHVSCGSKTSFQRFVISH